MVVAVKNTIEKMVETEEIDSKDGYAHVNYATHLRWYEDGHRALLDQAGVGFVALQQRGLRTFIRAANVEYLRELKAGDRIKIETAVERVGRTSMVYNQRILANDALSSRAKMTAVFVDAHGKPTAIPEDVKYSLVKV